VEGHRDLGGSMNTWISVVAVVGFACSIAYLVTLQHAVDKLQRQVEHLHDVMLKEFEKL
jgi:hypothetical protein